MRSTPEYIRRVLAGESPTFQSEVLSPSDRAYETLAVQLRRTEGIRSVRFAEQTGFDFEALVASRLPALLGRGLLTRDAEGVRLTRAGQHLADAVVEDLLRAKH